MSELNDQFSLTLLEALLLLCLNDQTGEFESAYLRYAIHAAALAELWRQRRIVLETGKVTVVSTAPVGDELLDVAISRLATCRRAAKLTAWIRGLYRDKKMPFEVLTTRLVRRGILTMQEARRWWVFHQTVYPTRDPAPEQQVRRRIEEAVLREGKVDEMTAVLVALLQACRMLPPVLGKAEVKKHASRIQTICGSNPIGAVVGKALAAVIEEDEAAATTGAIVAATAGS